MRKKELEQILKNAFFRFDQDTDGPGFWSPDHHTYARALKGIIGNDGWEAPDHRYTPFGTAGALRAHRISGFGNGEHLKSASGWIADQITQGMACDSLFYGGLWALAEAGSLFQDAQFHKIAETALLQNKDQFLSSHDLNYGVGLLGLSILVGEAGKKGELADMMEAKQTQLINAVNSRGIPATGDYRAAYHQRLMYTCWGLLASSRICNSRKALAVVRTILKFVVANRMDDDGGIRWHAPVESRIVLGKWPAVYPYGSDLYYECHQCFFLIAALTYQKIADNREFADVVISACQWIYGQNRWRFDLTDHGLSGLPIRCVSKKGRVDLPMNRFKGCYEVGAFLWAMAELKEYFN